MKNVLRGASGVAIALGLAGGMSAWAQQPQTVPTTQPPTAPGSTQVDRTRQAEQPAQEDKLIITGSFLATTPEDAPKPVEVFTAQDLEDRGSPSITEFIRTLNSAAPSSANVAATSTGAGILGNGFVPVDLRGQGANGTLVLMNGRRLSTTNGGAGADVNTIPTEALAAVEILKDGASATYGAGAVGGVINFRTRRDVDSPELTVSKTLYDGNDGGYDINFLTGWVGDNGNFLISLSKDGEDSLMATERGFSTLPYELNPDGWSLTNLPQRFHRQTNWATALPSNTSIGSGGGIVGGSVNDFTSDADCVTLGGQLAGVLQGNVQPVSGSTVPTACAFPLANVTELVSEYEQDQVYMEFNYDLSDTMELHFDMLWSDYDSTGRRPPSSGGNSARIADPSISALCTSSCFYMVPYEQGVYTATGVATGTTVVNPFIAEFNARQALRPVTSRNTLGPGGALLTSSQWRPYLFGGNPLFDDGLGRSRVRRERTQFNVGVNGEFAGENNVFGQFLNGVTYDFAAQWNEYIQHNEMNGDWLSNRLQDAIMGYGGPDCNALDRVATDYSSAAAYNRTIGIQSDTAPGTNGCMYFNPFQSNFESSIFNGAANPNFPAGATSPNWGAGATQAGLTGPSAFLNDPELLDWMWADRQSEVIYNSQTYDALFTGAVPSNVFELPGGQIGWALGSQFRITERRSAARADDDEELRLLLQDCPYSHLGQSPQPAIPGTERPTSRGCAGDGTGNFFAGASPLEPVPGERVPGFTRSETFATFAEVQLPVLDNLNFSGSLRNESFNGGAVEGTIWSVAGKWDITDELYVRGSYGTNFRAEEALDAVPGRTIVDNIIDNTRFGTGYQYQRITTTQTDIGPEDDTTLNVGIGYSGDVFGGRLRLAADFFRIDIEEEVVTTLAGPVLDNVFVDGATGDGTTGHLADCSARLIDFIQFNSGACQQGVTTAADVFAVIAAELNGPNFLTEGVDYSIDYSYPVLDGSAYFSASVTQNLTYEAAPFDVNGVVFDTGGDRLGYANTTRSGVASSKLRGNATIGWTNDDIRMNVRANYQDGYLIEEGTTRTPIINLPGAANDVFSTYGFSKKDYVDYDFNFIYDVPFVDELELRLSVLNLTDRDPPPDQGSLGVRTSMGNVRGRRIELGLKKVF
jgi:iron complex outermembrane receptor protein